ncbi:patatin-like phospholipase family protein [Dyadobacter arcticus]|uniref:PNPLA domain-containing protein n=1 Tax=Dyadobacter arcticus TaxID=1078754 RepID=A0ABX0UMT3_9BACT|nr:patatin-like phospholipase family protein [Dyadobacter arcticus]NIJ52760.1 hypothetical protein [Dyadobacter arcticus]
MSKTSAADTLQEPSLQLFNVLEEEYKYIHGTQTEGIKFLGYEIDPGLVVRLKVELENQANEDYSKSLKDYCYPYTKLANWIKPHQPEKVNFEISVATISDVLKNKIEDEKLIEQEPWLQDSLSLQPYTRGLLSRYLIGKNTKRALKSEEILELNRLLIRDAFSEYIKSEDSLTLESVFEKMRASGQSAICFSGGGIRSATFGLGIVQGLANLNLLDKFSYMSTVSGGGYLGSWLSAWSHHEGFETVLKKLKSESSTPFTVEADPIVHLRRYSNFLSPKLGLFSADSWTLFSTYLRNLLLIWLVIVPFLAALSGAPWLAVNLAAAKFGSSGPYAFWFIALLALSAAILLIIAVRFLHAFIPDSQIIPQSERGSVKDTLTSTRDTKAFIKNCFAPCLIATFLLIISWIWFVKLDVFPFKYIEDIHKTLGLDTPTELRIWSFGGGYIMANTALCHLIGWLLAKPTRKKPILIAGQFIVILVTGAFAGFFLLLILGQFRQHFLGERHLPAFICLAFPSALLAIVLAGFVFEGTISRWNDDSRREWTARHSGFLLLAALAWLVLTAIILYGPGLIADIKLKIASLGLTSGILTALLGGSTKTAGKGEAAGSRQGKGPAPGIGSFMSSLSLPVVALITLVVLLTMLSVLNLKLMQVFENFVEYGQANVFWISHASFPTFPVYIPFLILAAFIILGFIMAAAIDTNRFSLHAMYRARLIRAYLGASRPQTERSPDPFTGFDEKDNMPMGELDQQQTASTRAKSMQKPPFHVVNLALNLVSSRNLAWQERKAAAFSVTTLHAGAVNLGYRRTRPDPLKQVSKNAGNDEIVPRLYGGKNGISLGTAMTISGAAASPNMGYHSSPLIAFLMTMFNVRLGWWLGNPGPAGDETFDRTTPFFAVKPIWDELLANTDELNNYVYLSDGGHFENLGLYEMVLRRNRFILVSDAGCDEKCTLEDLGNAIRKIRIDLGIPVDFNEEFKIRARSNDPTLKGQPWALGRIRYSEVDKKSKLGADDVDGILLYVKPGLYGREPRDVFNYASAKPTFPHESTGDQFFSESQFESYRALGKHIVEDLANSILMEAGVTLTELFEKDGPKKYWKFIKDNKKAPV